MLPVADGDKFIRLHPDVAILPVHPAAPNRRLIRYSSHGSCSASKGEAYIIFKTPFYGRERPSPLSCMNAYLVLVLGKGATVQAVYSFIAYEPNFPSLFSSFLRYLKNIVFMYVTITNCRPKDLSLVCEAPSRHGNLNIFAMTEIWTFFKKRNLNFLCGSTGLSHS